MSEYLHEEEAIGKAGRARNIELEKKDGETRVRRAARVD